MGIIDLELKTLQSGHDFQSQGRMTLKGALLKFGNKNGKAEFPSHMKITEYNIYTPLPFQVIKCSLFPKICTELYWHQSACIPAPYGQGWGQFNSGIGIAGQFQFRNWNWNWNWNWWNWKWNWNWKPWNWNWNWNWKPELNFLQLLPQHLLINQPFPNFSFNREGHDISCDWLLMQQVCYWDIAPCGVLTKDTWRGYIVPIE